MAIQWHRLDWPPLKWDLVVESTNDPHLWGFTSPELDGYTGVGDSLIDAIERGMNDMGEYAEFMGKCGIKVPPVNPMACIRIAELAKEEG